MHAAALTDLDCGQPVIQDQTRDETKDGKYAHWLFVFGSAIGSMELEARKEHVGSVVTTP